VIGVADAARRLPAAVGASELTAAASGVPI
jgi:hypothetical protein